MASARTWCILLLWGVISVGAQESEPLPTLLKEMESTEIELLAPEVARTMQEFQSLTQKDFMSALLISDISEVCADHLNFTIQHYSSTQWGLKMFDSNAKIPSGILEGNLIHIGQYDECVSVDEPSGKFQGQHCMIDLGINILKNKFPIFYGVCVPSTCNAQDVQQFVTQVVARLNLTATVAQDPKNCRLRGIEEPSAGDWVVVGVLLCFVQIGVMSTFYDLYEKIHTKNKRLHQLYKSFSFYTNGKYLLSTTNDPSMMTSLFGIRTITMGWVVLGHAYLNTVYSPLINLSAVPAMNADHSKVIIFNSFVSVDTFFLLSGMLVCFVFFRAIGRSKTFDQPMGYVHRFLRLTPPYAAVVLLEATIFNYLGNGPMWNRIHYQASQNCRDYWWSSILYVQNYVNPLKLCLTQSWYLSADMQMYWVSPLVLYPMYLFPALAVPYLGFLLLGISFLDFAVVYTNNLKVNFVVNPSDDRMIMDYYPFHTRMAPWLVGVALGYILVGIKAGKIKVNLTPKWITFGWIMSTLLMTASFQCMDYFNQTPDYTALEAAFYLAFHRVGWALGLSWIIFACTNDIGGVVNAILSFKIFQPLARLSFCVYLVHISVQRFRIGWLRTNVNLGDVDTVWNFVGDFVFSNLISIPLFLLFEQPFLHIDRFLFSGKTIFNWPTPRARKPDPEKLVEEVKDKELNVENDTKDIPNELQDKSAESPEIEINTAEDAVKEEEKDISEELEKVEVDKNEEERAKSD